MAWFCDGDTFVSKIKSKPKEQCKKLKTSLKGHIFKILGFTPWDLRKTGERRSLVCGIVTLVCEAELSGTASAKPGGWADGMRTLI